MICRELDIPRVQFFEGDMSHLDWNLFDAFYLYNPFFENIHEHSRIDGSIDLNEQQFDEFVLTTKAKLSDAKVGTRVVTYHGFGGRMPSGYELSLQEPWGGDYLELWIKEKPLTVRQPSGFNEYYDLPCTD